MRTNGELNNPSVVLPELIVMSFVQVKTRFEKDFC